MRCYFMGRPTEAVRGSNRGLSLGGYRRKLLVSFLAQISWFIVPQVANAGVNEVGSFWKPKVENGKLVKPSTATVDINLVGTIYST
jgi:hypothetical protein